MKAVFFFCLLLFITNFSVSQGVFSDAKLSNDHRSAFIENKGQIIDQYYKPNPGVLYLLNAPGLNVQLRETGFSYDLYRISDQIEGNGQKTIGNSSSTVTRYPPNDSTPVIKYHRIDIDLLNTDPAYTIIPFDPDSDYRNYYTDGLPATGFTNVRTYSSILYENIYPGTDLQFIRDEKNSLKYNFILHPGADPERIRLRIKGASIVVDPSGSLRFETELGIIEEKIPECYYEIDGTKFPVSGSFKEVSDSVFGFAFDKAIPTSAGIVIDPTPTRAWGTYYEGINDDLGTGCSVDKDGNVFLTGYTGSPENIATSGAFQSNLESSQDAVLVKFSPSGIRQWGTYYGGNFGQTGAQCTIDRAGNIYIAGMANEGSNVATPGCFQFTCGGLTDAFLAKFSTNGYRIWSTFYGGEGFDGGIGMEGTHTYCKVDNNCNIYLSFLVNSDLLATPGTFREHPYNVPDCILAEFDSSGQRKWATYFGGEADDWPYSCSPDNLGHVYLSGSTSSTSQIATPGSHQDYLAGLWDCFLARFNTLGQLQWATYYGGSSYDTWGFCSTGANGEVYLSGETSSNNNISTPGSHQETFGGGYRDAFLVKFNSSGLRQWGTYYGGTDADEALSVTVDINGDILLTGITQSTNSIATPVSYQPGLGGDVDAFLAKFTPGGQRLWGTYYGGSLEDHGWDVCTDQNTNIYVTGLTQSTNNIASSNGSQNTYGGGQYDGFLVKFEDCPIPSDAGAISGPVSICIPQTGVVYSVPVINYATGYVWSVPSGSTIVSGNNTNSITVDYGISTANGKVSVFGTNTCGTGAISSINILVNTCSVVGVTISASASTICADSPVEFTATPVNGGTTPSYQWKVNGNNAGTDNQVFTCTPVNGDCITCVLTSDIVCSTGNPALSNSICMAVDQPLPVSVTVTTSQTTVCAGTLATFTANPAHGGSLPGYQWKVGAANVSGATSSTYAYVPLNGDVVTCQLTSSDNCVTGNPAMSPPVTMTVDQNFEVAVSITASSNPFCAGSLITFTATPNHGGLVPFYQWKVNGVNAETNSPSFSLSPDDGDEVICILNSSASCITGNPALSNVITMAVNTNLPAGISISTPANTFCPGTSVTITATPTNGGSAPIYQWKVNANNVVNANNASYAYNPINGDVVSCEMNSNLACATGNPATSNSIIMSERPAPAVSFNTCFDTVTFLGAQPFNLHGGLPLDGQYSGPGVNPNTGVFTPSVAGTGLKTITYGYANAYTCFATKTKTILVQPNPSFTCGNDMTDIRDNKVYPTVQIGSQCWMASNLDYGVPISGLLPQTDNCIAEKYHQNSSFYQWGELVRYSPSPGPQGLCPPGWHIPSAAEWDMLLTFYSGAGLAGGYLKDSLLVNGFHSCQQGFLYLNSTWAFAAGQDAGAMYWTSTASGPDRALARGLNNYNPSVSVYPSLRANAFSVRCLRD